MKKNAVSLLFLLVLTLTGCDDSDNNKQTNNSDNNNGSFFPNGNPADIDMEEIVTVNTFYVDPVNGSPEGDGSLENPWKDLQEVLNSKVTTWKYAELPWSEIGELVAVNSEQPVKGGDEIVLRAGNYGALLISESFNERYITIRAMENETPLFSGIEVQAAAKWVLRGLSIDGSEQEEPGSSTLLSIKDHNHFGPVSRILVDNCRLFSTLDISSWTAADWNQLSCNGIEIRGSHVQIQNNQLLNVDFGISVNGSNVTIKNNTIENFSGDGLRGLGQNHLFEGNLVKNCYDVNDNHDDGFQSWSIDGQAVSRIVLRGNTFINFTDPQQPLRGPLQGIGCFDGFYEDWLVENNLVIVDHWHGITFLGAKQVNVRNNTVITADLDTDRTPWILIDEHKDGRSSSGCQVNNNLFSKDSTWPEDTQAAGNYLVSIDDLYTFFVDYEELDFHLKAGATVIDQGSNLDYAPFDIEGNERPVGESVDPGAFEYLVPISEVVFLAGKEVCLRCAE